MADQEQVTKQNIYADVGLSDVEKVSKLVIYAIVNNNPPPPPPQPVLRDQAWIYG